MEDEIRPGSIRARAYFASIGLGLKWYNYEDLKRLHDLRLTTMAVGYLPTRLKKLMAEDAEEMSRRKWRA
jgi:hypothetical protein